MGQGCEGSLGEGKQVVSLLREKGYSNTKMDSPLKIECECGNEVVMETFETTCEKCGNVYGITPCHSESAENIRCAGKDF